MNAKLIHFAAALASSASLLAAAQPADTQYTSEPIASAAKADGGAEAVNAIVQALNADAGLKNAKITVAQDGDVVVLTGAAQTKQQVDRATEVASAGGATIVNAIQPDHTTYQMPAYELKG